MPPPTIASPHPSYPSLTPLAEHLALRSLAASTRQEYLRYVRKLAPHCGHDSATLDQPQARAYLLYLKTQKNYAPSSMRIACAALAFFFNVTLHRAWKLFGRNYPQAPPTGRHLLVSRNCTKGIDMRMVFCHLRGLFFDNLRMRYKQVGGGMFWQYNG